MLEGVGILCRAGVDAVAGAVGAAGISGGIVLIDRLVVSAQ